jgi:nitrate/nitrite-specific signal transduction histidine kinase
MGISDQPAVSKNLDRALAGHATSAEAQTADPTAKDRKLSTLFRMAKILAAEHDLETLLSESLSCLIGTLEAAEAGILLLHDPSDDRLTVRAAQGYDLTSLEQIRLAPGESLCGQVFQIGQAELYPTPEAIASAAGFWCWRTEASLAALCVRTCPFCKTRPP